MFESPGERVAAQTAHYPPALWAGNQRCTTRHGGLRRPGAGPRSSMTCRMHSSAHVRLTL
eukprot:7821775-Pyramimonas_sp.AAC.1